MNCLMNNTISELYILLYICYSAEGIILNKNVSILFSYSLALHRTILIFKLQLQIFVKTGDLKIKQEDGRSRKQESPGQNGRVWNLIVQKVSKFHDSIHVLVIHSWHSNFWRDIYLLTHVTLPSSFSWHKKVKNEKRAVKWCVYLHYPRRRLSLCSLQ